MVMHLCGCIRECETICEFVCGMYKCVATHVTASLSACVQGVCEIYVHECDRICMEYVCVNECV